MHLNYEFKARTARLDELEASLQAKAPRYAGEDAQTDTYFQVAHGRLKLREGNIENSLIHYVRHNIAGAKQSDVILYNHEPSPHLKAALTTALGIKVVVEKRRRIYFVDNVKIHFDRVAALGTFVEVEAIDSDGSIGIERLREQCTEWAAFFGIQADEYVSESYSDLLLKAEEAE
ncbi:class IV adenylate cyclase [Flaviaesturariibacter amylovorans]|uniref:CYTH domain-containing protein n=1 Tax=Flaviaesturariibacter amylovorans TaxID=1084520 RepID=A0ABP8HGI9_9BACT